MKKLKLQWKGIYALLTDVVVCTPASPVSAGRTDIK